MKIHYRIFGLSLTVLVNIYTVIINTSLLVPQQFLQVIAVDILSKFFAVTIFSQLITSKIKSKQLKFIYTEGNWSSSTNTDYTSVTHRHFSLGDARIKDRVFLIIL